MGNIFSQNHRQDADDAHDAASSGDRAAAKRVMSVIAPVIIVCMVVWTFCALYFMNMIFAKVGTSSGIITSVEPPASETPSDPYIQPEAAVRMACKNDEFRYDFYLDNSYEYAYALQAEDLDSGTYVINGDTFTLTNKTGNAVEASYVNHVLIVEHDLYNCEEYNGA